METEVSLGKIDEVAQALGVMDYGMESDVTELSGGPADGPLGQVLLEKPDILCRTSQPTIWMRSTAQRYLKLLISHDILFLNDESISSTMY